MLYQKDTTHLPLKKTSSRKGLHVTSRMVSCETLAASERLQFRKAATPTCSRTIFMGSLESGPISNRETSYWCTIVSVPPLQINQFIRGTVDLFQNGGRTRREIGSSERIPGKRYYSNIESWVNEAEESWTAARSEL